MTDSYVTHAEFQEARAEINERFVRVETQLESINERMATKADLNELKSDFHKNQQSLILWIVGTAVSIGAAFITIMTFVLNNAAPKAPAAPASPAPG